MNLRQLVLAGAVVLMGFAAQADVIVYREVFPNNTEANITSWGAAGWFVHRAGGAQATGTSLGISNGTGRPNNATPINSNPASGELVFGYMANWDAALNGQPLIYWTNEYTVDRSASEVASISWYQGNQIASDVYRVALQIGGAWYASDQTFTNPAVSSGTLFATDAAARSLDFSTAAWRSLNFVPDSSLSLGGAVSLPSGNITAFGLFTDNKSGTQRFDTFTITTVPEPGSTLLALLGLLGLLLVRRR